jgi:hypothetical protein
MCEKGIYTKNTTFYCALPLGKCLVIKTIFQEEPQEVIPSSQIHHCNDLPKEMGYKVNQFPADSGVWYYSIHSME